MTGYNYSNETKHIYIDEYFSFCLVTLFLTGLSQNFSNNRKYFEFHLPHGNNICHTQQRAITTALTPSMVHKSWQ